MSDPEDPKRPEPQPADESRRLVLARRARFIAAAVAGVGIACGSNEAPPPSVPPAVCLSPMPYYAPDGGPESQPPAPYPAPCLSPPLPFPMPPSPDGGSALPSVPPSTDPLPTPCLSVVAPPVDAGSPSPQARPRGARAKPPPSR